MHCVGCLCVDGQEPDSWYSWTITEESPRDASISHTMGMNHTGSMLCHRQHSQTPVFSSPPWTSCQVRMIKLLTSFIWHADLESRAIGCALFSCYGCSQASHSPGERKYPSAWSGTQENVVLRHHSCQIWAKTELPLPTSSPKPNGLCLCCRFPSWP